MPYFDTERDPYESISAALTARDTEADAQVDAMVQTILADIKAHGDAAVVNYTQRFDWPQATATGLAISPEGRRDAHAAIAPDLLRIFQRSAANITRFHEAERAQLQSWSHADTQKGIPTLGQLLRPVQRVGVYVPGGKAAYPSTVLMAGIPARVAGVEEIVVCTPPDRNGQVNPAILAAMEVAGIDTAFRIGGAQAIAAMAYGTETVPKVDVIVGPGNPYVNSAKRLVYGEVGLDMLAGPSEVAIVADETAHAPGIAADLLAQTEHGPENRGVLFCSSAEKLAECQAELDTQRALLSRREILAKTAENLIFVKTQSLEESMELSNLLAPEHLELCVADPDTTLSLVKNAGAVLLGQYTSAPVGDYIAGPSHTLPTAGTARFSSPLSVATFVKRTSVISYSRQAAQDVAEDVARFAEAEGFDAHAQAARLRAERS